MNGIEENKYMNKSPDTLVYQSKYQQFLWSQSLHIAVFVQQQNCNENRFC